MFEYTCPAADRLPRQRHDNFIYKQLSQIQNNSIYTDPQYYTICLIFILLVLHLAAVYAPIFSQIANGVSIDRILSRIVQVLCTHTTA